MNAQGPFPGGVLVFLWRDDAVLVIEGSRRKAWAGRVNVLGGAIQDGEDPLQAASREIREESGLVVPPTSLRLGGVFLSRHWYGRDWLLFLVVGEAPDGEVRPSDEGDVRWVRLDDLAREPDLVEDLHLLIPPLRQLREGEWVWADGLYDGDGRVVALTVRTLGR